MKSHAMPLVTIILTCAMVVWTACTSTTARKEGSAAPPQDTIASLWPKMEHAHDTAVEKRIASLLSTMSLDRKIGQMMQIEIRSFTPDDMKRYRFGSVLSGGGSWPHNNKHASITEWVALADSIWQSCVEGLDNPIPPLWGIDAVHGHNNFAGATLFPHNIALGAAHDTALMRSIGQVTACEVAATGLDWDFAPTVAVVQNDRWGRTYESYSEMPEVVASLARNYISGLQGTFGNGSVLATAKHYIGDGGTGNGDDRGNTMASEEKLIATHAAGYIAALNAGVQTIMVSYSSWQGTRMHAQRYLLTDVLKNRLGFDGLVISDWDGIETVAGCSKSNCPGAVNAGIDMFMIPLKSDWQPFFDNLKRQVESGEVPMSRIDDAVSRILRVKLRTGLFERKMPGKRADAGNARLIGAPEHRAIAREAVRKSLVLLKNNSRILPLDRKATILVAGHGADSIALQAGGWSISWQGDGNTNRDFVNATSILDGIKTAAKKVTFDAQGTSVKNEKYDAAIVVIGERPYAEFRGDVEGGMTLEHAHNYPEDLTLLQKIKAAGIPVVTILLSGRPLCINRELNCSDAFIAAWLPGSEGAGIADVLFRSEDGSIPYDFTGTLPFSWPKQPCQANLNKGDDGYDPLFRPEYGLTYAGSDTTIDTVPVYISEGYGCNDAPPSIITDSVVMIFDGKFPDGKTPWMGDPTNWSGQSGLPPSTIPTLAATLTKDKNGADGHAVRLSFTGSAYWGIGGEERDMSGYYTGDYSLAFDVCVNMQPRGSISVAILCTHPCEDEVDITATLRDLPALHWQSVRLPLKQFMRANFLKINSPFQLFATDTVDLSIANVRWEK